MVGGRLCCMVAHTYCCGVGGSWRSSKTWKKTDFYANKSVDGLQLGEYLADFGRWGTILIVTSCLTLIMPYFTSGGHILDLSRCSRVRQLKVTLRPDQQGDRIQETLGHVKNTRFAWAGGTFFHFQLCCHVSFLFWQEIGCGFTYYLCTLEYHKVVVLC